MGVHAVFSVIANLGLIALLIAYGLMFFAEYHARGRWAKNVTSLLAGLGMMVLAACLVLTPHNAEVITGLANTKLPRMLLGASSALLPRKRLQAAPVLPQSTNLKKPSMTTFS